MHFVSSEEPSQHAACGLNESREAAMKSIGRYWQDCKEKQSSEAANTGACCRLSNIKYPDLVLFLQKISVVKSTCHR
jgi:hypothetical protein